MTFCFPPFFKAIGDPVRQQILNELKTHKELSVNEIVKKVDLTQATVSHHLAILKKAQVVQTRQEGTQVFYSICCEKAVKCCDQIHKFFKL